MVSILIRSETKLNQRCFVVSKTEVLEILKYILFFRVINLINKKNKLDIPLYLYSI